MAYDHLQQYVDFMENLRRRRADPQLNPGREWRKGKGEECAAAASNTPGQVLYQGGYAPRNGTHRVGYGTDVRPGELYPHPGDPIELWPSVFAGYRDQRAKFVSGGFKAPGGGHYFMPLHRRLDLDRVLVLMDQANDIFTNVRAMRRRRPRPHKKRIRQGRRRR